MKKVINESNEIDIYVGSNGLYFDPENKNLSYLSSIAASDLTGLEEELSKKKASQIILGKVVLPAVLLFHLQTPLFCFPHLLTN